MNITATSQPLQVSAIAPEIHTENEDLLENTDPEMALRKKLIETLFGAEKKKTDNKNIGDRIRDENSVERRPEDTVSISSQAMELYRHDRINLSIERNRGRLDLQYERVEAVRIEASSTRQDQRVQQAEPLVIDLDNDGIELTDVRAGGGVKFDLTGDGRTETVSWVAPSDAFLAYDRNANGFIDSGAELFGDQHGAANGFIELAKFDGNTDGVIDSRDDIYSRLWVWRDINSNGVSEENELGRLAVYGIESISLTPDSSREIISGNLVAGYSRYATASSSGRVGEVFLNYIA